MAERDRPTSEPNPSPAPEEMHWGINYLREDIQDMRLDLRDLRSEMQARFVAMDARFEAMQKRMDSRFVWTLGFIAMLTAMHGAMMTALIKL